MNNLIGGILKLKINIKKKKDFLINTNTKEPQYSIYADTGGKEEIDYESRFNTIGWNIKNENSECFFDFLVE